MTTILSVSRAAFLEAWANRRSFWFQVTIMVINDLALIAFWLLFFQRVGEIRGWGTQQVMTLYSVLAIVAGLTLGLFSNCRRLGQAISQGELDAVLTLPLHPLAFLLARRVNTAMLGDLVFGPLLFIVAAHPTPQRLAVLLLSVACGSMILLSFLVMLGSLAFFAGDRGEGGELGFQAILILASYPLDMFGGLTKILLFTVLPAAFITGVPVHLIDDFSWRGAAVLVGVAGIAAAGAMAVFRAGLRKYRSGAAWTRA
ncbi:MAG TPA: ABC-2 family transporter protein [Actinomycetota bacterium]|jgi:ABC-2 type transport system permease protein|nr:ABC-2 family transporter protein [Actinomycetota bacterium]